MAKFMALSRGAKLVLVAGPLLLFSLFSTWQDVQVDYGPAGVATLPLDGWDAWGLLLAALVVAMLAIVSMWSLTDVAMSEDIPWDRVVLGLGLAVFGVAVLKNLTDAGSSRASYGFVALAGIVALGGSLDWLAGRRGRRKPVPERKRRGLSSTA